MEINAKVAIAFSITEKRCNPFPHESNVFRSAHFPVAVKSTLEAPRDQNLGVQKALRFLMENHFPHFSTTSFVVRMASSKRNARTSRRREKRPWRMERRGFCEAAFRARQEKASFRTTAAPHFTRAQSRKSYPFVSHSTLFDGTMFLLRAESSWRPRRAKAV